MKLLHAREARIVDGAVRGTAPDAALVIEVAPGMDIEWLTDVALKHDDVKPGNLVVERQFGYLEFHSKYAASVQSAGAAVLEAIGATPASAIKPEILASKIVDATDAERCALVEAGYALPAHIAPDEEGA